jgi:hypothetical protein
LLGEYWKSVVDTIRKELYRKGLKEMAEYPKIAKNIDECIVHLKMSVNSETF